MWNNNDWAIYLLKHIIMRLELLKSKHMYIPSQKNHIKTNSSVFRTSMIEEFKCV